VKGTICRAAKECGLSQQFIGGHPMAGSEKTGFANSTATLLENACYLLTPTEDNRPEDIRRMQELVSHTGAVCYILSPQEHDKITAAISHVPHIIAVLLVQLVLQNDNSKEYMKVFAAGGFKDITRIASSSPAMWQDICIANKDSIDLFLRRFEAEIEEFRKMIAADDKDAIYQAFQTAGDYRNSMT
jgi:prephenate dehydrogenase